MLAAVEDWRCISSLNELPVASRTHSTPLKTCAQASGFFLSVTPQVIFVATIGATLRDLSETPYLCLFFLKVCFQDMELLVSQITFFFYTITRQGNKSSWDLGWGALHSTVTFLFFFFPVDCLNVFSHYAHLISSFVVPLLPMLHRSMFQW